MKTPLKTRPLLSLIGILAILLTSAAPDKSALKTEILWDEWYTVVLAGGFPYAYFNEKFEVKGDKVHLELSLWKNEEGFINVEKIGAFSKNDIQLSPLFYNYQSNYRTTKKVIDATVQKPGAVLFKIRAGEKLSTVNKRFSKKSFFASMFPLWLGRILKSAKIKQTVPFAAISEDAPNEAISAGSGYIRLDKADKYATESNTKKINVFYRSKMSTWWVFPSGKAKKIQYQNKTIVELSTKEKAQHLFEK